MKKLLKLLTQKLFNKHFMFTGLKHFINRLIFRVICLFFALPARFINRLELRNFKNESVDSVIIFVGGGIGNLVLVQPLVRSCLKAWSGSNISLVVVSDVLKELSGLLFPEADVFVLPVEKKRFFAGLRYLRSMIQQRGFSVCFSTFLERKKAVSWWGNSLGAKMIVGFENKRFAPWQVLTLNFNESAHEIGRDLKMLEVIGIRPEIKTTKLDIPEDLKRWTVDFLERLKSKRFIGIHSGTNKLSIGRRWPAEKFVELIKTILDKYEEYSILFFIGPDDEDIGEEIRRKISSDRFIAVKGLGISQVAGLISKCECFISNDSGLMHIAGALKIPLVAIWGPTNLRKSCPTSDSQIIIKKDLSCMPCYKIGEPIECVHRRCLTEINVSEVIRGFESLIKEGIPR